MNKVKDHQGQKTPEQADITCLMLSGLHFHINSVGNQIRNSMTVDTEKIRV